MSNPTIGVELELHPWSPQRFAEEHKTRNYDRRAQVRQLGVPSGHRDEALAVFGAIKHIRKGLPDTVPNQYALAADPGVRAWVKRQLGVDEPKAKPPVEPKPKLAEKPSK